MDEIVRVPMTEAEKAERGERLAAMLKERQGLVDAKKKAAKDADEGIEELDAIILDVATDLREGKKDKAQRDLFVDEAPAPDQAAAVLAEVATRAEGVPVPPGGISGEGSGAWRHCEHEDPAYAAGLALVNAVSHGAFACSCLIVGCPCYDRKVEPHAFDPSGFGADLCTCGFVDADPIHAPQGEAAVELAKAMILGGPAGDPADDFAPPVGGLGLDDPERDGLEARTQEPPAARTRRRKRERDPNTAHRFASTGGTAGLCWCERPEGDVLHAIFKAPTDAEAAGVER